MSEAVRTRTRDEVLKDFRTQEILGAARRVIGDLGFGDASMERIAQEAGVAKGTLYLYFESKERLLEQAIADGLSQLTQVTREAVEPLQGSRERLSAAVRRGMAHARDNRAFFQAVIDARRARLGQAANGHRLDAYTDFVTGLVEDGVRSGELRRVDPGRAARTLVHVLSGLVGESLFQDRPLPGDVEVDATLDLLFQGLASAGEAS